MSTQDKKGPFHSRLMVRGPETRAWPYELYDQGGKPIVLPEGTTIGGLRIDCVRNVANRDGTRLGWLEYGCEPDGDGNLTKYDSWIFHELGGTVTVIWTVLDNELYIGFIRQLRNCERHERFNKSGSVLNLVRGFLDKLGDEAEESARRETYEEAGVFDGIPEDLGGQNVTVNNAWFAYDDLRVGGRLMQGGVRFYGLRVKPEVLVEASASAMIELLRGVEPETALQIIHRNPKNPLKVMTFAPGALKKVGKGEGAYEMIKGQVTFIPASLATDLRDGFASAGVGRLRSWLEAKGAAKVTYDLSVLGE